MFNWLYRCLALLSASQSLAIHWMSLPNRFTDQRELYKALLAGENDAFVYIYKLLYQRVSGHIFEWGGNSDDRQVIVHETIIAFVFNLKYGKYEWREEAQLMTYLIRIAHNKLNELRRNRNRFGPINAETPINEVDDPSQLEASEQNFEKRRLAAEKGLMQLKDKCREAIRLYYLQKKSMEEIAELLGWANEQVARNKKYRCLQKLRQLIGLKTWSD